MTIRHKLRTTDCPRCGRPLVSATRFVYCPLDGDVSTYGDGEAPPRLPPSMGYGYRASMTDEPRSPLSPPMDDGPVLLTDRIR